MYVNQQNFLIFTCAIMRWFSDKQRKRLPRLAQMRLKG
jgi:hypothetical protein